MNGTNDQNVMTVPFDSEEKLVEYVKNHVWTAMCEAQWSGNTIRLTVEVSTDKARENTEVSINRFTQIQKRMLRSPFLGGEYTNQINFIMKINYENCFT
jgi:hypothetical protein